MCSEQCSATAGHTPGLAMAARAREAFPLLCKLEEAVVNSGIEEGRLLVALLLMAWAGLRWSDLQRLDLSSISVTNQAVSGWCWRAKNSKTGFARGFLQGLQRHDQEALLRASCCANLDAPYAENPAFHARRPEPTGNQQQRAAKNNN